MNAKHPEIMVISGATATGKTALGVALAQTLQTDVISCDSQLVYREMDIGTAKPTEAEMQGVPHYGMNLAAPDEVFSAAAYAEAVLPLVLQRIENGQPVLLVGGTGFYLRQLLEPTPSVEAPANPAFREELKHWAKGQVHPHALYEHLKRIDPARAAQLYPEDEMRIIRALEIIESTGKAVPQEKGPSRVAQALGREPRVQWVGLHVSDASTRYARIHQRVEAMVQAGWLNEVEALVQRYGHEAHALGVAHGYPEMMKVLAGEQTLEEAIERTSIQVRQYARRQRKWFNRHAEMQWLDVLEYPTPESQWLTLERICQTGF